MDVASPCLGLDEDLLSLQDLATQFATKEMTPHAAEWDATHHFPYETLQLAAGLGFGALFADPEVGGSGMGRLAGSVIFEALVCHAEDSTYTLWPLYPAQCPSRQSYLYVTVHVRFFVGRRAAAPARQPS